MSSEPTPEEYVILTVRNRNPDAYRRLGLALLEWLQSNPGAKVIYGLSELLEGKHPKTPTEELPMLSFCVDEHGEIVTTFESVAMALVAPEHIPNLRDYVRGFAVSLYDMDTYSQMAR